MKKVIYILLAVFATLAACSKNDAPDYGQFRNDMVTYTGSENGAASFCHINSAHETSTLVASNGDMKLEAGKRLLLNYVVQKELSGNKYQVEMRGYTSVVTDTLRATSAQKIDEQKMEHIKLRSIWRTGNFLNLHCEVEYTEKTRMLTFLIDEEKATNEVVDCYLVHDTREAQTYFWRTLYTSVLLDPILATAKTLRVHVNDEINPDKKYYEFNLKN